ncbi:MHC class II regulatory factor RFX1-like [Paramacrobiotus metropolitanus]|uniref:MHC class II regulatory factor RFX1-like n=1 Tax=Paramacrobiotus metropolitanus TaxID=2943436 RepID=UPI0024461BA7|nr:MHC class II regulatory factor RFX1-like [Paramacrobiotus metropolitanus]
MPRNFLYHQYEGFCQIQGKPPMNRSSLGKTVMALFPGLQARRFGHRGKCIYHYTGLAVNPNGKFGGMLQKDSDDEPAPEPVAFRQKRASVPTIIQTKKRKAPSATVAPSVQEPLQRYSNMEPEKRWALAQQQLKKLLRPHCNRRLIPLQLQHGNLMDTVYTLTWNHGALPYGLHPEDIFAVLRDFRVHIGLLGHSIANGILLAIPEILGNFYLWHNRSLQIPATSQPEKFHLALQWQPLTEVIGQCLVDLYGSLTQQLLPSMDEPLNERTLQFVYEFASKYAEWVKAVASQLSVQMQVVLNAAAITFCQTLKQLTAINRTLGITQEVKTDPDVIHKEFQAICERFILISNVTHPPASILIALHNLAIMGPLANSVALVTRWRGWLNNTIAFTLEQAEQSAADVSPVEVVSLKEATLSGLREIWMGFLTEIQKLADRSAKDCSSPLSRILDYFLQYTNYIMDHFMANLHGTSLLQHGYETSKGVLESTDYLHLPAMPIYDISFFSRRLIDHTHVSVYDVQYYSQFTELRRLIYAPDGMNDRD